MRFMALHYANLSTFLKPFINENLSEAAKAKSEFWKALSADRKFQRVIEKIAGPVLNGIVSLTTGFLVSSFPKPCPPEGN
jgi:hypothetical protein